MLPSALLKKREKKEMKMYIKKFQRKKKKKHILSIKTFNNISIMHLSLKIFN